jgi:hypothetical protein
MKGKDHIEKSKEMFGIGGNEVHQFLDQYSRELGADHRPILHNWLGVELCRLRFGVLAGKIAYQHILDDNMNPEKPETEV